MSMYRFAGGKHKLISIIDAYLRPMLVKAKEFHDIFLGGASVLLWVAEHYPHLKLKANDLDENIYSFWHIIACGTDCQYEELINLIKQMPTIEMFKAMRKKPPITIIEKAYHAIYFNRTTFSGMAKSGPMGGYDQSGPDRIDSRYNPDKLISQCNEARSLLKGRTAVTNLNALDYLKGEIPMDAVLYLDPPYYLQGPHLYPVFMTDSEHEELSRLLQGRKNWVLSYDVHEQIQNLYSEWASIGTTTTNYSIAVADGKRKPKNELIIMPRGMSIGQSEPLIVHENAHPPTTVEAAPPTQKESLKIGLGPEPSSALSMQVGETKRYEHRYFITGEAAAYMRKSVSWLLRQKDIPYIRGRPNTYDIKDLDEWIKRNKTKEL